MNTVLLGIVMALIAVVSIAVSLNNQMVMTISESNPLPYAYSQSNLNQTVKDYSALSQIMKTIKEANDNGNLFDQIRDKCANAKTQYEIATITCIAFFQKFNNHMKQLWNESKTEVVKIGIPVVNLSKPAK